MEGLKIKQYHVGIILFNDVDVLDFAGPYEVFNLTTYSEHDVNKLLLNELDSNAKPFRVSTVSEKGESVIAHNGLKVQPDYSFQSAPLFDIVVVPGGPYRAIKSVSSNEKILSWIASQNDDVVIVSVCTGALFLAKAGLLNGKQATTNRAALDLLEKTYPEIEVIRGVKYVDQGNIVTAAGVSAGINMSLYIVEKLFNKETSMRTANTIEFN